MKNLTRFLSLSGIILAGAVLAACQPQPDVPQTNEMEVTQEIQIDSFEDTTEPDSVADLEAQAELLQFEEEDFSDL